MLFSDVWSENAALLESLNGNSFNSTNTILSWLNVPFDTIKYVIRMCIIFQH